MKEITINALNQNQRLDKYIMKLLNTAPKSLVYKLLRKKKIKLNGKRAEGNELLREGDVIRIYLGSDTLEGMAAEKELPRVPNELNIIFEDENILACSKPAGLLSHGQNKNEDSLISRIWLYLNKKGEYDTGKNSDFTPALCNRLDRNTSGLVLCGKNLPALQELNRIMAENRGDKLYLALVEGRLDTSGVLEGYHIKNPKTNEARITQKAEIGGKPVRTEYEPLTFLSGCTLLRIKLISGKSHQIRAHMQSIGHPLAGDPKYQDKRINAMFKEKYGLKSQLLHSERFIFTEPEGVLAYLKGKELTAPLNGIFEKILEELHDFNG